MPLHATVRFAGKTSKLGNAPSECEDDFCAAGPHFAVADGASEGSFSHVWASILVRSFCLSDPAEWRSDQFAAWIQECRAQWSDWERELVKKELPWFTQAKLRQGSFATFLGVSISEVGWYALGYGDSCLFVVRDDALAEAFPISQSDAFDNTPTLVSTSGEFSQDKLLIRSGELRPGDRLYLTSDALSNWFLADYERGEKPWVALDGIASDRELEIFVSEARESRAIKNDDVTLVSLAATD